MKTEFNRIKENVKKEIKNTKTEDVVLYGVVIFGATLFFGAFTGLLDIHIGRNKRVTEVTCELLEFDEEATTITCKLN